MLWCLSLPRWTFGTPSRCSVLKSKKLLCLEGETPERQEESLMPLSSLVGPAPRVPFPLQNMLGTGGSQEKSWGTLTWRDLPRLEALGSGVLAGGHAERTCWWLPSGTSSVSPGVLTCSSGLQPDVPSLGRPPAPRSGFPDSSPWGFLIPFAFNCHKQITCASVSFVAYELPWEGPCLQASLCLCDQNRGLLGPLCPFLCPPQFITVLLNIRHPPPTPTPSGFEYFSLCLFFNSLAIWYLECGFLCVYTVLDKLNFLNPWAGLFHGFGKILGHDLSIAFAPPFTSVFLGLQLHACWASELNPIGLLSSFKILLLFFKIYFFGCSGSSWLCAGFLWLQRLGGYCALRWGGFSCCRAQALGM